MRIYYELDTVLVKDPQDLQLALDKLKSINPPEYFAEPHEEFMKNFPGAVSALINDL